MCAIAGILGQEAPPEAIAAMLATMARRGPDDRGVFQEEGVTLLHARLAVIDPAGGRQPMTLHFGGEEYTIVYNGELYNTGELRRELAVPVYGGELALCVGDVTGRSFYYALERE